MATSVNKRLQKERQLLAELPSALPDALVYVGLHQKPIAQLCAEYQEHLDLEARIATLRAQLANAMAEAKTLRKTTNANTLAIRTAAAAALGEHSNAFAALGFEPRKVGKPSIATRAAAVEKRLATRVARHTAGPRQKAAIHGAPPAPPMPPEPAPPEPDASDASAASTPTSTPLTKSRTRASPA
jgi:hypothetical protein